jgi:hypothetical protein
MTSQGENTGEQQKSRIDELLRMQHMQGGEGYLTDCSGAKVKWEVVAYECRYCGNIQEELVPCVKCGELSFFNIQELA